MLLAMGESSGTVAMETGNAADLDEPHRHDKAELLRSSVHRSQSISDVRLCLQADMSHPPLSLVLGDMGEKI